jgi:hypothetical protein
MLVWSDTSISECPGCGATIVVGIMSLCATCPYDGYFYVDASPLSAWYSSPEAFRRGDPPLQGPVCS